MLVLLLVLVLLHAGLLRLAFTGRSGASTHSICAVCPVVRACFFIFILLLVLPTLLPSLLHALLPLLRRPCFNGLVVMGIYILTI